MQNEETNRQDQEVLELLKDYPMPAADAGYFDQALVRATHEGSRRQRNRWMLAGFGAAGGAALRILAFGSETAVAADLLIMAWTIPRSASLL